MRSKESLLGDHPAQSWDVYWQGTRENAAHEEGGPQELVLKEFWRQLFTEEQKRCEKPRILDLACGNGAVTGFARDSCPEADLYAMDYSINALLQLRLRHPAQVSVGDAHNPPFALQSFDVVASQFGVEYAGRNALLAIVPAIAPGGLLAVVMHQQGGAIHRECELNLRICHAMQASSVFALGRLAFSAGFALNRGDGSVGQFKAAERNFTPAVRALEDIIKRQGEAAASGLPHKIHGAIAQMYKGMSAYDESDVLDWIDGMEFQVEAYAGRMSSMIEAAVDQATMFALSQGVLEQGFEIKRLEALRMGSDQQEAAWVLVAHLAR